MSAIKIKQIAFERDGVANIADTSLSSSTPIPRAFDIELEFSVKAHEYNYDKGGLFSDQAITRPQTGGTPSNDLETSMDTTLSFKTYLHGYKEATNPIGTNLANLDAIMPVLFENLLGGVFIPASRTCATTTTGTVSTSGQPTSTITYATSAPSDTDLPDGGLLHIDAATDNRVRWVKDQAATATTSTVKRDYTVDDADIAIHSGTVCFVQDAVPAYHLNFELATDDTNEAYICIGCFASSATINLTANELPTVEWEFRVAHAHRVARSGTNYFNANGVGPLEEESGTGKGSDKPYPFSYGSLYTDVNTGTTAALDVTSMQITINNTLSPKVGLNNKFGISAWALTDRTIEVEMTPYFSTDFESRFLDQARVSIDCTWPLVSTAAVVGTAGIVSIDIPAFRIKEFPNREDADGQIALSVTGMADYAIGDDPDSTTSDRNDQSSGAGYSGFPTDSEFKIGWT